jgi:uncharacterized SAM-binding protein YcdF (DUF218 family)
MVRTSRALGRAAAVIVAAAATVFLATFAGVYLFSEHVAARLVVSDAAPLVIVLGGGVSEEGDLHPRPNHALRTALDLHADGRARRLHFSGGALGPIPEATVMRERARRRGIAEAGMTVETRSTSTLQNALFTVEEIGVPPPGTVILTDRAHLPRAWATFWWAGARGHRLLPAEPWPGEQRADRLRLIAREALAIWYNGARMAGASLRLALGAEPGVVAAGLGRQPGAWGPPP